MSRFRQSSLSREERDAVDAHPRPVVALALDYPLGHVIAPHKHARTQFVHAESGLMRVTTRTGAWVVPPGHALWMPAGVIHEIRALEAILMRTLYLETNVASWLPEECWVVAVPPLLRNLISKAVSLPPEYNEGDADGRFMAVLLDELKGLDPTPLHLPFPADQRLRGVVDTLLEDPGNEQSLDVWARSAGASSRTLARLFVAETGLTFGEWRRRRRLLAAVEWLTSGHPVTRVALDLGYDSPSAFIAMFKRHIGATPGQFAGGYHPSDVTEQALGRYPPTSVQIVQYGIATHRLRHPR